MRLILGGALCSGRFQENLPGEALLNSRASLSEVLGRNFTAHFFEERKQLIVKPCFESIELGTQRCKVH